MFYNTIISDLAISFNNQNKDPWSSYSHNTSLWLNIFIINIQTRSIPRERSQDRPHEPPKDNWNEKIPSLISVHESYSSWKKSNRRNYGGYLSFIQNQSQFLSQNKNTNISEYLWWIIYSINIRNICRQKRNKLFYVKFVQAFWLIIKRFQWPWH